MNLLRATKTLPFRLISGKEAFFELILTIFGNCSQIYQAVSEKFLQEYERQNRLWMPVTRQLKHFPFGHTSTSGMTKAV